MLESEPLRCWRFRVEFQWFLTALSVLPVSSLAITAHTRARVRDGRCARVHACARSLQASHAPRGRQHDRLAAGGFRATRARAIAARRTDGANARKRQHTQRAAGRPDARLHAGPQSARRSTKLDSRTAAMCAYKHAPNTCMVKHTRNVS